MTVTVGAYEAKTRFSELLATAAGGEAVVITKHGHPVAQLVALKESASPVETTLSALAGIRAAAQPGPDSLAELIHAGRRV